MVVYCMRSTVAEFTLNGNHPWTVVNADCRRWRPDPSALFPKNDGAPLPTSDRAFTPARRNLDQYKAAGGREPAPIHA
eukprot:604510-Rhodomonas_salina.1